MRAVPLSARYSIYISDDHAFGTDAVLLADFAAAGKKKLTACDFGTGCGIVPMLLVRAGAVKKAVGVELQEQAVRQAEQTVSENGLTDTVSILQADFTRKLDLAAGSFDLVTCNPPYAAVGSGILSETDSDQIARHETACSVTEICEAAARLVRFGGRFCICQRPDRLTDYMVAMREAGLEPKRLRFVITRQGEAPWLVLLEGRRGGKPGLAVMPPLYTEENGVLSREMLTIYGDYKEGHGVSV